MARGPAPFYQPPFAKEQCEEAQRLAACTHAPYLEVQRAKMVLALRENPQMSNTHLGELIGVHRRTVQRWRKRWTQCGFDLADAPRSGRLPDFSPSATRPD